MVMVLVVANIQAQSYNGFNEFEKRAALPNFFSKVANKEKVSIAYMGGSITQQEGYRLLTMDWFNANFPEVEFERIDAAIGGTNSKFAVFRLNRDVLRFDPDLVFIEFAVNDLGMNENVMRRTIEGIVRQTWNYNPNIDICFLYTARCTMFSDYQNSKLPSPVKIMEEVAQFYNIPSINLGLIPAKMAKEGNLICSGTLPADPLAVPIVYSKDGVHPYETSGHVLYTESISRAMDLMKTTSTVIAHEVPVVPIISNNYEKATLGLVDESMLSGTWKNITDSMSLIIKNYLCTSDLYTYRGYTNSSVLNAKFTGPVIGVYVVAGPTAGRIDVSIDGGPFQTFTTFEKYSTKHRPYQLFFNEGLSSGEHSVQIKVNTDYFDKRSIIVASRQYEYDDNPEDYINNYLNAVGLLVDGEVIVQANSAASDIATIEINPVFYPNPANDFLNINMGRTGLSYNLEIINLLGKKMLKAQINGVDILDIKSLDTGIYFLKIYDDQTILSCRRFIKN